MASSAGTARSFVMPYVSTPRALPRAGDPVSAALDPEPRLDADAFAALICDWCLEVQAWVSR